MNEPLSAEHRETLLKLAAATVEFGLTQGREMPVEFQNFPPPLRDLHATFVTLRLEEDLQGCIGTLRAVRPLAVDVVHNAYAAGFDDPRGRVLTLAEIKRLHIHISILGQAEPLACSSEEELLAQVRPGIDGLIIEENGTRGTLLPAVWESLSDPREFVRHLKLKAGLSLDYWSSSVKISRYTTESFSN
jgi:uncharacterized protein